MEAANSPAPEAPVNPALRTEVVQLKQGDTVGSRFVIDERLREDVTGAVYRAVDEKSGKKIAILMMDPALAGEKTKTERLRAAVKQATALAHKNIVSIFGMGKEGRRRYVAREYVDGQTLSELLEKKALANKHFTLKGAYNLVAHVCNGLHYALPAGHGSLRPSVVLINRTGRVKVSDFGLGEVRPAIEARREHMGPWDLPCFPVDDRVRADDLYAMGMMLYSLLVGTPPADAIPALPAEAEARLPDGVADILRRCVDPDAADRFADPNALKTELLQVIESARGHAPEKPRKPSASAPPGGATIEVMEETPAPLPPSNRPSQSRKKKLRAQAEPGGFVIPELRPAGQVEDDGTKQRWLVAKDGTDYGPFTRKDVVQQLREEKLTAQTVLYDIETDRRLELAEFSAFDDDLVAWTHERAELEKKRAEDAAAAAAARRTRVLVSVAAVVVLGTAGSAGGWFWYQSTLPTPVRAHLASLVSPVAGTLPAIPLPEELPETAAEVAEKARKKKSARRGAAERAERAREMREARMAANNTLDAASGGTGARFNRGALDKAIASRSGKLMGCLGQEAARRPGSKTIKVKLSAIPRGDLINVHLVGGTTAGSRCASRALRGLKVPAFDGTPVKITLPFQIQ